MTKGTGGRVNSMNGTKIRPSILVSKRTSSSKIVNSKSTGSRSPLPMVRSRSPVLSPIASTFHHSLTNGMPSPSPFGHSRHKVIPSRYSLLPTVIQTSFRLPRTQSVWKFSIDSAGAGECILLIGSVMYATRKLDSALRTTSLSDTFISLGLFFTIVFVTVSS